MTSPRLDSTASPTPTAPTWKINLLYDGECPLCVWEVNALKQKDKGRGLVKFTDIAADTYSAEDHGGVDYATAMGRIHAVLADGTVINNMEVFRQVYRVLGAGWIYAPTGWPIIGPLVDWVYGVWARWRLAITGRPSLETLLAEREARRTAVCEDRCRIEGTKAGHL